MTSTMPKFKLYYFPWAGRCEQLRMACVMGKIAFTNHAIPLEEWPTVKPNFPLGQIPCLEITEEGQDSIKMGESIAILRYLGRLGGLYPSHTDPLLCLKIDAMVDYILTAELPIELTMMGPVRTYYSETDWTQEEKLAMRKRNYEDKENGLPFWLSFLEQELIKNGGTYIVGDSYSIADIGVHTITALVITGYIEGLPTTLMDSYPALLKHMQQIEALPEVAAYRAKHPQPYGIFDHEPLEK